jgi:CheY-like chemotaxis protein
MVGMVSPAKCEKPTWGFLHVGLLVDEPSGIAGLRFIQSLDVLIVEHEDRESPEPFRFGIPMSSIPPQRSCSTMRLPVSLDLSEATTSPPQPADAARLKLLVIDDNVDAADSLRMLLTLNGHAAQAAHDSTAALQAAQDQKPDAILMDIGLPGLNGYQLAERVRATPGLQEVILVAVTGYGQPEDQQRSKRAGFDHHMVKPVDHQQLRKMLALIAQQKPAQTRPKERQDAPHENQ